MTRKERYKFVIDYFEKNMPVAETELAFKDPYQLLVAVILSAQCTDKRVNLTTPAIFKTYPDVRSLSKTTFDDLFPLVKSISYPNNKTKHLIGMAQKVVSDFNEQIPMTSVVDNQPNMAVDTHVFRVSKRLGLVPQTASTLLAVEKILIKNIPEHLIHKAHHWLILHGRYTCLARNPKCVQCGLQEICIHFRKKNTQ